MYLLCVHEHHMSEDMAYKRIQAAPAVPSDVSNAAVCMEPLVLKPVVPSVAANVPRCMEPISSQAASRTKIAPSSPGRFTLQLTMGQVAHDLLREARTLLGHAVPSGDVEAVLRPAPREMVEGLKKQKFAETARLRAQRGSTNSRYIAAEVKRAALKRDGGQCTFVSESGRPGRDSTRKCQ